MLRLFGLLAYLLVSISIGMTSVAHATEPQGGATIAVSQAMLVTEYGHSQGDADEVPADSDKGYPHHHVSCHGDHVAAPTSCAGITLADILPDTEQLLRPTPLPSRIGDPALRPPQA